MSSDYASKEKAFLESLQADTGRDLSQWMSAINEQDLAHRNDIIDWLRQEGFIFSRASWLERIHHNGGRPIYLSELPPSRPPTQRPRRPSLRIVASNPDLRAPPASGSSRRPPKTSSEPTPVIRLHTGAQHAPTHTQARPGTVQPLQSPKAISDTIDKAKAYSPLARHILSELLSAVPGATTTPFRNHLEFAHPEVFCALVMSPNRLRLCLDLGAHDFSTTLLNTKMPNPIVRLANNLTHMVVLDDARQIDAALIALLKAANTQVNG